ncbi:MAG: CarD family transcriptional regulator, partial [Novosphingobium sp.]
MSQFAKILSATTPLTLASLPRGAQPLVLADLARAGAQKDGARAVFIAPDEAGMQGIVDTAAFFAPELEVLSVPAWDCLPYDRASPALSISARRLAALHRLQAPAASPQLLVTTINAVLQRVISPFRVRENVRLLKPGMEIPRESLVELLQRQGYSRTDTVADAGEYAVRGSIFDIYPSGLGSGLRLDFFGDELETLRLFDPNTQRSTGTVDEHLLLPASEALLDEASVKRFRGRYRDLFGASATSDPLYQAVSDGRRLAGMEHWLPLFEDKLVTLFDHLGTKDLMLIDSAALGSAEERLGDIADYFASRTETSGKAAGSYRPLEPAALYLTRAELDTQLAAHPVHRTDIFAQPASASVIDAGFSSGRDFAPERARGDNVYEATARFLQGQAAQGKKALIAAYSEGSRARISAILGEAVRPAPVAAASWQEALGLAAKGVVAAVVLPLDNGFSNGEIELVTEQDVLGDRLVRRKKRRKGADAFLAELAALTPGDLVVHLEHGIGRYGGLQSIPVGQSPHDCVMLEYAGGDKLYVPVENIDVLSRYGSDNEFTALDRLGGEGWQKRKSRLKERIRAIAHELLKTAAQRALKQAPVVVPDQGGYDKFVEGFPWQETEDQEAAID